MSWKSWRGTGLRMISGRHLFVSCQMTRLMLHEKFQQLQHLLDYRELELSPFFGTYNFTSWVLKDANPLRLLAVVPWQSQLCTTNLDRLAAGSLLLLRDEHFSTQSQDRNLSPSYMAMLFQYPLSHSLTTHPQA